MYMGILIVRILWKAIITLRRVWMGKGREGKGIGDTKAVKYL